MRFEETIETAYDRRQKMIDGKMVSEAWMNKRRLIFHCIGFYTEPEHRGNGYATELSREILIGRHIVFAKAISERSVRVLKKLGFKRLILNRWVYLGGKP